MLGVFFLFPSVTYSPSCRLWLSATSYLVRFTHGGAQWAQIAMGERPGALSDKQFLASDEVWGFFHIQSTLTYCLVISANVQHCTWLARSRARPVGSELSAASGTEACRQQWWKQAGGAWGIARSACATMRVPRRKQRGGDRNSKGALARLLGSPDRNAARRSGLGALGTEMA